MTADHIIWQGTGLVSYEGDPDRGDTTERVRLQLVCRAGQLQLIAPGNAPGSETLICDAHDLQPAWTPLLRATWRQQHPYEARLTLGDDRTPAYLRGVATRQELYVSPTREIQPWTGAGIPVEEHVDLDEEIGAAIAMLRRPGEAFADLTQAEARAMCNRQLYDPRDRDLGDQPEAFAWMLVEHDPLAWIDDAGVVRWGVHLVDTTIVWYEQVAIEI